MTVFMEMYKITESSLIIIKSECMNGVNVPMKEHLMRPLNIRKDTAV